MLIDDSVTNSVIRNQLIDVHLNMIQINNLNYGFDTELIKMHYVFIYPDLFFDNFLNESKRIYWKLITREEILLLIT